MHSNSLNFVKQHLGITVSNYIKYISILGIKCPLEIRYNHQNKLSSLEKNINFKKHGRCYCWYDNGAIQEVADYNNDKRVKIYHWFPTGLLFSITLYDDNGLYLNKIYM